MIKVEALGTTVAYILLLSFMAFIGNIVWEMTGNLLLMIIAQYAILSKFNELENVIKPRKEQDNE